MRYRDFINEQVKIISERDAAFKDRKEVFLYPSFKVMWAHEKAHKLYLEGKFFRARKIAQRAAKITGIDIHPGATIGKGFFIDHGFGVVIGETAVIGDNCTLYQGVTLGGTGKEKGKRHPTIGNNVMISCGAKVLGNITIGDNCKIGSGSVVLRDIPDNSTVVGVPGHVVKRNNVRVQELDLDQVHLPDPVQNAIDNLKKQVDELSALVNAKG